MGNSTSKNPGEDRLAIECMAKYMSMSKQQLIDLRNRCYMAMDNKRKIDRRQFNINVQLCKIKESPDGEILDALFTMWDLHGADEILCPPFILSLAPLACEDENLEQILTFAFHVFAQETNGKLTADRLVFMLKRKFVYRSPFCFSPSRISTKCSSFCRSKSDNVLFRRQRSFIASNLQGCWQHLWNNVDYQSGRSDLDRRTMHWCTSNGFTIEPILIERFEEGATSNLFTRVPHSTRGRLGVLDRHGIHPVDSHCPGAPPPASGTEKVGHEAATASCVDGKEQQSTRKLDGGPSTCTIAVDVASKAVNHWALCCADYLPWFNCNVTVEIVLTSSTS